MAISRRINRAIGDGSASPRGPQLRSDHRLAELAGRQHGIVAARQLLALGFTRMAITSRLDQGRLHELHRGVYAVGHQALTQEGWWLAAVLAAGPDAVLSHRDGLALWDVAKFRFDEIEVTVPGLGSRSRRGIKFHRTRRLDPLDRAIVRGIPVTSLARTLLDAAGVIAPRHLRQAYLEAGRRGLLDADDLARVVTEYKGKRGIGQLRNLLAADNSTLVRTRSQLEVAFFDFCREEALPEPLSNHRVHGYELDAYWPDARLAVELDSWEFHQGRGAFERDRRKVADLKMFDIDVVPVTDQRLKGERGKLAAILRETLARRSS